LGRPALYRQEPKLRSLTWICGVLAAALAAFAPTVSAAPLPPDDRRFVNDTAAAVMQTQRVPGVSVGLWGPAGNYVSTYGVRDVDSRAPLRRQDHVRIASITKSYVATEVLRQVDRGTLSLTDTLDRFIRGVPNGGEITIAQLLGMQAGTYDFTMDAAFGRRFAANPLMRFGVRDVLRIIRRHKPSFRPGARVQYSDTNYTLLGVVLEKVTGRSPEAVIKRDIIDRLGLRGTSFPTRPRLPGPFSHGYYAGDDGTDPVRDYTLVNPDVAWTAGGMVSTLDDLRTWGRALARGTLLSKRLHARQLRFGPIPNPGSPIKVGYGLGVFKLGRWIGHNGAIYGFSTITMYLPGTGAQFVAVANLSTNFSTQTIDVFVPVARRLYPGSI
jgi:D-alanyl-D-alanine carboxypeptidase